MTNDSPKRCTPAGRARGFTLVELALTLTIIAVMAVGVLVPFVAQVSQRRIADTERTLELAREALMGYAAATGRLPCPATATSAGAEAFATGGTAANGNCASFNGFLPAATLGFTPIDEAGFAVDGWGTTLNRIRYAVSNTTVNGTANPFTRSAGMRAATPAQLAAATTPSTTTLLHVCASSTGVVAGTSCGTATRLTDNAPAVIWSLGPNAATGGTSADEAQNLNGNRIFVSHIATSGAAEFDDIVTWLSVGNLVSRMVLAGQLP